LVGEKFWIWFINIIVRPLLAEAITVFITMLLGEFFSFTITISFAAPPFMKRQLMRMMIVPETSIEMFYVSKLLSILVL
jgi:hypothetical protein